MSGIDYLKKLLSEEGFRYEETDRVIKFKYQGGFFAILIRSSSSRFVQLVHTGFYETNNDMDRIGKALTACNEVNKSEYIVKLILEQDYVWCSYEFIPNSATTGKDLIEALDAMLRGRDSFMETVKEL